MGRFVAIAQESVEKLFMQAGTLEGQLLGRYGLRVAPLSEVEQRYFEVSEGIVINEVWDGYLGARTGLEPGDLIVSMDGAAVRGVEDVRKLVLPVAREFHELAVRRGQRTRKVSLPARSSSEVTLDADHSGALLAAPQGFPIGTVIKGSPAAQAGIQPGDRLLRVDQTQIRTDAQARQALANGSGRPRYLVLSRGARRWGALLQ